MDGAEYAAAVSVELVFGFGIAYLAYDIACGLLYVNVSVTVHLSADNHETGGAECLAGDLRVRILTEEFIKDSV